MYKTPGANNMNKNGKIKRPMNAFMVWARTYRAKMAEAFPNTTNSDVSVRLGQVWHEMTDEQKRPYYREAERIKQRHKMLYPGMYYPHFCVSPLLSLRAKLLSSLCKPRHSRLNSHINLTSCYITHSPSKQRYTHACFV